jgi:uncharacterized protein (DUF3084 family)
MALASQIERYEREAERHEKSFRDLENHISLLDTTNDNKALLEELQQREIRIEEMEKEHRERQATLEQEKQELQSAHQASSLSNSLLRAEVYEPLLRNTTSLRHVTRKPKTKSWT